MRPAAGSLQCFPIKLTETIAAFDPEIDSVLFVHALEHATEDLHRIATLLADRYLNAGLTLAWNWHTLLEIDEQALSNLAFQSRNEAVVVATLPRIGSTTLPGVDLCGFTDWRLSVPSLPIVYRCVTELQLAAPPAEQEEDVA
ncbi:DUF2471 family protein [Burkholderia pyrrocinia]|nr:DUF2471 family protein [Burkholderia pyrrocinia]